MRKRVLLVPDGMADLPHRRAGRAHAARGCPHAGHGRPGARRGRWGWCAPSRTAWPRAATSPTSPCSATTRAAVYTGRAPLEAASIGVELGPDDVAYRCNLVTIADGVMQRQHRRPHRQRPRRRRARARSTRASAASRSSSTPASAYRNLMVWRGGERGAAARRRTTSSTSRSAGHGCREPAPPAATLRDVMASAHAAIAGLAPGDRHLALGRGHGAEHAAASASCAACAAPSSAPSTWSSGIGRLRRHGRGRRAGRDRRPRHRLRRQGARGARGAAARRSRVRARRGAGRGRRTGAAWRRRCAPSSASTPRCWRRSWRRAAAGGHGPAGPLHAGLAAHARRPAGAVRLRRRPAALAAPAFGETAAATTGLFLESGAALMGLFLAETS